MEDDVMYASLSEVEVLYSSTVTMDTPGSSNHTAENSHKSIQQFFIEHGKVASTIGHEDIELNSCSINSILRPYQRETVKWMLLRELIPTEIQIGTRSFTLPRGGILADEMGLGKTVEMLACILGNPHPKIIKRKSLSEDDCHSPPLAEAEAEAESSSTLLGKRPAQTVPAFLAKRPRLNKIKQNLAFKAETRRLMREWYCKFQRKMKRKIQTLNEVCCEIVTSVFSILVLNRYYKMAGAAYAKEQAWGYLISEFDAHEESSLAYAILARESQELESFPQNGAVSDENAESVITLVQEYLTDKVTKNIVKELDRAVEVSRLLHGDEFAPMLENEDVQCRCGSDKAQGNKVMCPKCKKYQHLKCVGLSRPPANGENYLCPCCWMNEQTVQSGATLIVIPDTLTQQWTDEIRKHASDCNLKIYWYRGVSKGYILPTALSEYDIVLITTTNLAADLDFVNPNSRTLRHVKRYQQFVTPLTCIRWWRLCIDEAQSVEGVNKVSEMASRLETAYLWAVTGTPIVKSLRDLYGLTVYLRMEPFVQSDAVWKELISGDQHELHRLFAYLMRRKTKHQVQDQLGLPPLTYNVQWLSFPPVEGYVYDATHASSCEKFRLAQKHEVINWQQSLKRANKDLVNAILAPLLSLRQACVNPMRSTLNVFSCGKEETYQTLLEKMVKKTKTDCENLLRTYVMFVNGGARAHMSKNEIVDAVALYRSLLKKFDFYKDLTPDSFQHIHVMHQLLEAGRLDPAVELADEEKLFPSKIEEIETKCVNKFQEEIDSMKTQMSKASADIENYERTHELKEFSWWDTILRTLDFKDISNRLTENLRRDNIKLNNAMKLKMSSANRMGSVIESWLEDVARIRSLIFEHLEVLMNVDSRKKLALAALSCHAIENQAKGTCAVCRTEHLMLKYEVLLFSAIDKNALKEDVAFTETNWKHTAIECALNVLLSCSRATTDSAINHTVAGQQLKALSGLRREFKWIRAVWSRQCDLLNVCQEIITAKSRMDNEFQIQPDNAYYKKQIEMYVSNSTKAYSELQQKYGSLQYLKNLDRQYKSGENVEETCPICHSSLHEQRAVLTCGHFTCYCCMQFMMKGADGTILVKCPVCRSQTPSPSITYVHGGGTSDLDFTNVVGNHPIKIRAITATVLRLIQEDANVKILVFSTWEKILSSIERAFDENKIASRKYTTGEQRRTSLSAFKTKDDVNVLLMPLKSGSKGLNLTEASHIIFAEPVLNTADEEQAVGRIHRMGQERSMTVHKFIIRSSVEEKIHKMNEEFFQGSDSKESQLKLWHLRELFEISAKD